MCCRRQLFTTWEFTLTVMSLCGLKSRVRCRDVLLCYDSSAASDVQCPIPCSIRWSCRLLCHVSTTATQHSQGFHWRGLRNASISSWLCSFTDACMVWRHGIFPTTSRASPTPTAAVFSRRHLRSWWFDVHGCPPSAIEHFRWLVAASWTVCRLTLPQLQPLAPTLFFGITSKLSFSPDHFLTNCFPFLVLYAVYCSGLAILYLYMPL